MADTQRLFFALWPTASLQQEIQRATRSSLQICKGRILPAEKLHITLAYFGSADADTRQCLEQAADNVVANRFSLPLSELGFWKRPKVTWLAPSATPTELLELVMQLNRLLIPCGYQPETRAYLPHMTLVRKAQRTPEPPQIEPLPWQVDSFALIESVTLPHGAEYRVLREWPLA